MFIENIKKHSEKYDYIPLLILGMYLKHLILNGIKLVILIKNKQI